MTSDSDLSELESTLQQIIIKTENVANSFYYSVNYSIYNKCRNVNSNLLVTYIVKMSLSIYCMQIEYYMQHCLIK